MCLNRPGKICIAAYCCQWFFKWFSPFFSTTDRHLKRMVILSQVLVTACPHRYFQFGRSKGDAQIAGARGAKTKMYLWENATLLMLSSAQMDCIFHPQHCLKNSTLNLHRGTQILGEKKHHHQITHQIRPAAASPYKQLNWVFHTKTWATSNGKFWNSI